MRKLIFILWAGAALALSPASAHAWPGTVVSVADGDSVTVAPSGDEKTPIAVRLYGIDAPELGQAHGPEAAAWLREQLPIGQLVEVVPYGTDKYRRTLGLVQIGPRTLNGELVAAGLAWVYYPYCEAKFCGRWYGDQKKAAADGRGLWQDEKPEKPGAWRKRNAPITAR